MRLRPDSQEVISAFFALASALLRATESLPISLIEEISSWLESKPYDTDLRERFLRLLGQHYSQAPAMAADAITETLSWLTIDPDASDVRRALLGLLLAEPAHPQAAQAISETLAWLGQHPKAKPVRDAWSLLLKAAPVATVAEAMTDMLALLADHQDEMGARSALSVLARALSGHPDAADIVAQVHACLEAHPDNGGVKAGFLALVRELPHTRRTWPRSSPKLVAGSSAFQATPGFAVTCWPWPIPGPGISTPVSSSTR